MEAKKNRILRPLLFIAAGALAGLAYYYLVGCASGTCPITATPLRTAAYTGVIGYLLSIITKK